MTVPYQVEEMVLVTGPFLLQLYCGKEGAFFLERGFVHFWLAILLEKPVYRAPPKNLWVVDSDSPFPYPLNHMHRVVNELFSIKAKYFTFWCY